MKMAIKTGGGTPYARKEAYEYEGTKYEADLQDGDKIKILADGEYEKSNFGDGEDFYMNVETRNGEKKAKFGQASINVLVESFGEESSDWVGKEVTALLKKGGLVFR
jgi:hypothetical protein